VQAAKEEWGRLPIFNVAVWPFADGDVVVQPYARFCACVYACVRVLLDVWCRYNTVCALASLQSHSDAVLCLHNADAAAVCKRRLNITHPSMKDINSVFASQVRPPALPSPLLHAHHPPPSPPSRSPNSSSPALPAPSSPPSPPPPSTSPPPPAHTLYPLPSSSSCPFAPSPPFGRMLWPSRARAGTRPFAARRRCLYAMVAWRTDWIGKSRLLRGGATAAVVRLWQ